MLAMVETANFGDEVLDLAELSFQFAVENIPESVGRYEVSLGYMDPYGNFEE